MRLGFSAPVLALGWALVPGPASLLGCASETPSRTPLGWGPLPKGAAPAESSGAPARRASRPPRHESPASLSFAESDDEDETSPANTAESKSGSNPDSGTQGPGKDGPLRAVPSKDWAGDYRGEDVALYRLKGIPDRTEKDPKARTTVKAPSEESLAFVVVDSSKGNEICTLNAALKAGKAIITEGQHCFDQSGGSASLTAVVKSGSATLDGKDLHLEALFEVEVHLEGLDATGTLKYRFDGTRR